MGSVDEVAKAIKRLNVYRAAATRWCAVHVLIKCGGVESQGVTKRGEPTRITIHESLARPELHQMESISS